MSKILITGAAGFIGSQLAYKFLKEGHKIVLIDNMSYGHEDNLIFDDEEDGDLNLYLHKVDIRDRNYSHSPKSGTDRKGHLPPKWQ